MAMPVRQCTIFESNFIKMKLGKLGGKTRIFFTSLRSENNILQMTIKKFFFQLEKRHCREVETFFNCDFSLNIVRRKIILNEKKSIQLMIFSCKGVKNNR